MNTEKTVCLLNDSFPPLIDGVANTVVNYARVLTSRGDHAMVLTPKNPDADDSQYPYPVIRYPSIDLREIVGYPAGIPFSPEAAERILRGNVSLLHSHCPIVSTIWARKLRSMIDVPLVMTYHTKFDVEISHMIHGKLLQSGGRHALVHNISACDEVWVVSSGAGENLRSLGYEGEYIVMPNGVDLPLGEASPEQVQRATEAYHLPPDIPIYLFVGRMQWYKGQKLILDALAKLARAGADFRMVFIGLGADYDDIKDYASSCGLEEKCIFTGAIRDREALRCWYTRADLFLFPSTFDTNGLVVREAAACSVASVLIKGSCAAEGVTDGVNGFLIDESSESLFALLSDLSRQTMRDAGVHAAYEVYISWDDAVENARHRYEIVIDRYRSGLYPPHNEPMEILLKADGELMEDIAHLLKVRSDIRSYVKSHIIYPEE